MEIRNRVRELRMVPACELRPHPGNWRTHPMHQQQALRSLLAQVGYAGALVARELQDGSLELLDGHLRAKTTPESEVPVLIVDLSDAEADLVLATFDPLAALAQTDDAALRALVGRVACEDQHVCEMLAALTADPQPPESPQPSAPASEALDELFQVVVECPDDAAQRTLYQRLTGEGFRCRMLLL